MKKTLLILVLLLVVGISSCTGSLSNTTQKVNISFVQVMPSGLGNYGVNGRLVPNQDMDYIEVHAAWYGSNGIVIEKSPSLWNVSNARKGLEYQFSAYDLVNNKGTPVKADILIFDSVSTGDASKAIYKTTLNL